jgi:hypothetical protein
MLKELWPLESDFDFFMQNNLSLHDLQNLLMKYCTIFRKLIMSSCACNKQNALSQYFFLGSLIVGPGTEIFCKNIFICDLFIMELWSLDEDFLIPCIFLC